MPANRRQFIKQSLTAVGAGLVAPRIFFSTAFRTAGAQSPLPGPSASGDDRRVVVIIELSGGNDGLNTVIPYTDSNYFSLRPTLGFKDTELADAQGNSTIISNQFGLHPSMGKLKRLYDAGKVAIVTGVGYPDPSESHFESADIWHAGETSAVRIDGWLGRYADQALLGRPGLTAIAVDDRLPKTLLSQQVVVPSVPDFQQYGVQTDDDFPDNRPNKLNALLALHSRSFPQGSFIARQAQIGYDAVKGSIQFQSALQGYTSSVQYPDNNGLADGLKMLAQVITTIPEVSLLYLQTGGFDTHSDQIANTGKRTGQHAELLQGFSDAVDAFHQDLAAHQLADKVIIFQWSEFGRRPGENASHGTDHGSASSIFVIGDSVRGGLYGQQPSLAPANLDDAGNPKFTVDFRSVYATILTKWLGGDPRQILGADFENVGFLG
jgi:uncharacterized protein (DUF1501 family)